MEPTRVGQQRDRANESESGRKKERLLWFRAPPGTTVPGGGGQKLQQNPDQLLLHVTALPLPPPLPPLPNRRKERLASPTTGYFNVGVIIVVFTQLIKK